MQNIFFILIFFLVNSFHCQFNIDIFKSETDLRAYIDENKLEPVEGIYNYEAAKGEIEYKIAVLKKDFKYFGYILSSSSDKWTPGKIKFRLDETAYENIYGMNWVMSRGKNESKSPALYKNAQLKFMLGDRKMYLHKIYPKISSNINKKPSAEENSIDSTEIETTGLEWEGNGSGIFISKDGYIVTNFHVVNDSKEIEIDFKNSKGHNSYNAKVIKVDAINDLAIVKIDDEKFKNLTSLPYNFNTKTVDVGTEVFALGYPMALSIMGKEIKFTDGKISSKTGYLDDVTTYQTTTPIQPGNSGGPLFDFNGNLIGINSSGLAYEIADNVSYSIKSSYVKNLIDVLPQNFDLPNDKSLDNKNLTEIIKVLSDYVVLIKVK